MTVYVQRLINIFIGLPSGCKLVPKSGKSVNSSAARVYAAGASAAPQSLSGSTAERTVRLLARFFPSASRVCFCASKFGSSRPVSSLGHLMAGVTVIVGSSQCRGPGHALRSARGVPLLFRWFPIFLQCRVSASCVFLVGYIFFCAPVSRRSWLTASSLPGSAPAHVSTAPLCAAFG